MNCKNCGFPLSPTNTSKNCPICHAALASGPKAAVVSPSQQYENYGQNFSSSAEWKTNAQANQFSFPPVAQTPFPQPGQVLRSTPTPSALPITSSPDRLPAPMEAYSNSVVGRVDNRGSVTRFSAPRPAMRFQKPRTNNTGFIVAGLCLITGGILLVFVHFMALGLPPDGTASVYTGTTIGARNTSPSPAAATPSPTLVVSPTSEVFPGQQYINNPQLATMVNTNTAQPTQVATTFKVNQRIFITFNIHPNGKNGAVCLFWFLNSRIVTQYPFSVTASANAGYSYAVYEGAGQAYVEIYWASSTACTDKILAQHVNFTVTG